MTIASLGMVFCPIVILNLAVLIVLPPLLHISPFHKPLPFFSSSFP